ncbi:translocation/assembly module TamB domain-containing protein [Blattabacterium cuenoti]|uniref:Translocation and assembly module TamB C-terminal domain-containing protein n=1 Tax=Blattabacterium cuenoti STAT TaxID=1457030 RepID=A0A224AHV7_9FLAO|nr:translocation/assembly module TamB domain-containing protein [Blattabacterium cuenoti]BBA16973.1 hypothetical protein STAT_027 [Blattabacterium cuenoti STAT]
MLGLLLFSIYHEKKIKEKVSTFLLKIFLKKVKNRWNEKIIIKHASINFLEKELILHDVKILDHHYFSFIRLSKCKISIDNLLYFIFINSDSLRIKNIFIENSYFFIKKYFKEKENNIIFFIRDFLIHKKLNKFHNNYITCSKLIINKSYLEYQNKNKSFNRKIFQKNFYSCIKNIRIDNQKIKASILSFQSDKYFIKVKENKIPFIIKHLSCDLIYYFFISKLKGKNIFIKTSNSLLKGNFIFFQNPKKNKKFSTEKNIQCQILEGSKLGSDLGILFYKKWNSYSRIFIKGTVHGEFNPEKNKFFLYNISIKESEKNKLIANQIHIIYNSKKEWKKIKFFKILFKIHPHYNKRTILSSLSSKFKLDKIFLSLKNPIIYKGDLLLSSFENDKKNLKIKGTIQNRFFAVKILTDIYFFNKRYTGQIFIDKKYLFLKKKNSLEENKIQFLNSLSNLSILNFKEKFYNYFITILLSHSKYKILFTGKKFKNIQKAYINITYNNKKKTNRNIKIIFINNNKEHPFQKIKINIHDMIIGHIYESMDLKNLFNFFCLKNSYKKETKYFRFNFLIKKYFFDFIKNKNKFSDIQISGEKKDNIFRMIFYTKFIQFNNIFFNQFFLRIDSSLKKKLKIHIEKIIYKKFFSKKINISVFNPKNLWIINSKFLFKRKGQEYEEQVLNFFCKKEEKYLIICKPFFSKLNINGYNWLIDSNNNPNNNLGFIKIDLIHQKYIINNIVFYSDNQKIIINANYFKNKQKIFQFYLKNLQLKKIIFNKNIDGLANGFFYWKNVYNQIEPNININFQNFSIGKKILGNFSIFSSKKNEKYYEINGFLRKNSYDILKVFGFIKNESKNQNKLNLNIIIQNLKINNFSFYLKKINSKVRGTIKGKIQIFGHLNDPHFLGKLEIQKFGIIVNSANTNYEIINPAYINIFSEFCTLSNSCFVDTKYNTKGYINGFFLHKNLIQWNLIKLSINTKRLIVLDLKKKQNNFLFGKIFTHGKIQITKKENQTLISMKNGRILNSSHLYINYKSKILENRKKDVSKIKLNDFKKFKKREENNSLLIDINTTIDKNTKLSILLNKIYSIEFIGDGFFLIKKTLKKNIKTSGSYFVKNGFYSFHYNKKNKIPIKLKKTFKIKTRGSISWINNFDQSNIDLIASKTKYAYNIIEYIGNFFFEKNTKNMILTELRIYIYGKIKKPNIYMDILLPDSKENIQKKLSEKLKNDEEKTMQFISILVLGKFIPKKNFFYFFIYKFFLNKLKDSLLNNE